MKDLKNLFFGITGSLLMVGFLTIASFAAVTKNIVLNGGVSATASAEVLVHNALPVTARFKVKREGSNNDFAQRRVEFKLISGNGQIETSVRSIGGVEETVSLNLPAAGGSNSVRTWRAEMKNMEAAGNAEVNQAVSGTVEFFTTGSQTVTIPAPTKFGIVQSGSAERTITMPFTGNLTIQANWDTDEISLENYPLKFELYKGNTRLDSDTGYSRDSVIVGISSSQRMKISYRVKATDFQIPGNWKIKVYGSSRGKVKNIDLKMSISDGLF